MIQIVTKGERGNFHFLEIRSDDSSTIVTLGCPNIRCYAIDRRFASLFLSCSAPLPVPIWILSTTTALSADDHCAMTITQHDFRRTTHSLAHAVKFSSFLLHCPNRFVIGIPLRRRRSSKQETKKTSCTCTECCGDDDYRNSANQSAINRKRSSID